MLLPPIAVYLFIGIRLKQKNKPGYYSAVMNARRTFIKQIGWGTAGLMLAPSLMSMFPASAKGVNNLPRSTPEMQGVSSDVLGKLFDAMDASGIDFHSVMVMRNGFVIGEGWWAPYAPPYKHSLYSLSKSFTSCGVGLAINERHFTVESQVISFFPKLLPAQVSPNLAALKVKHLLTMNTGHAIAPPLAGDNWAKTFLDTPIVSEPGTNFVYNTAATYMLSAIVTKTTGKTLFDFLTPRIFEPLKIEGADWEVSPQGINSGGVGLRIRTEDIASFSQLYLNKGKWKGKQLVPESWIAASSQSYWDFKTNPFGGSSPKANDDWQQGYGYQFWRTKTNGYRSDGLYGQFGIILPEENLVVAITEESFKTQQTLDFVWDILLPGLSKKALPANAPAVQALKTKQEALKVTFPAGLATSGLAEKISGKKFLLDDNELGAKWVTFNIRNNTCAMTVGYEAGERKLNYGFNGWELAKNGRVTYNQLPFPVQGLPNVSTDLAGRATWKDANTLYLKDRPVETVNSDALTVTFDGSTVKLSLLNSVVEARKQKDPRPQLTGRMA